MVPFWGLGNMAEKHQSGSVDKSTRRHRIHVDEVPQVKTALLLWLRNQVDDHRDLQSSAAGFRCLYRLQEHRPGRPDYPKISWQTLKAYVRAHWPTNDDPFAPFFTSPSFKELQNGTIPPINASEERGSE